MKKRPSLLLLSQIIPYPPDAGVAIRTFNILRELSVEFDVTALCFHRRALGEDRDAKERGIRQWADTRSFPIPQNESQTRLVWDHLRSLLGRRVYTRFVYESAEFSRALDETLRSHRFQLAQLETLDLVCHLDSLEPLPTTCVHHNVESDLLRRRSGHESGIRRAYLAHQASLMEREERTRCGQLALNIAVSQTDRARLEEIAPSARFLVVPNGVDLEHFQVVDGPQEGIAFTGGTTWFPNKDALEFFSGEILPRILRSAPDATTQWVGRALEADRQRYAGVPGLVLTGYVPDVRPYVHGAACVIVPLRVGGGTRLKILDAWAMGKAVVSTSVGCEGLSAVDEENILIRDDPEAFASTVCELLRDPERRARLGRAARATVERKYSWQALGESLRGEYRALVT